MRGRARCPLTACIRCRRLALGGLTGNGALCRTRLGRVAAGRRRAIPRSRNRYRGCQDRPLGQAGDDRGLAGGGSAGRWRALGRSLSLRRCLSARALALTVNRCLPQGLQRQQGRRPRILECDSQAGAGGKGQRCLNLNRLAARHRQCQLTGIWSRAHLRGYGTAIL